MMELSGNVTIRFLFNGSHIILTKDTLDKYYRKMEGKTLLPCIHGSGMDDIEVLYALFRELVPFSIKGNPDSENVTLNASLERFPYTINGKGEYLSFGIRLMPESGSTSVGMEQRDRSIAIDRLSVDSGSFSADLGNGNLHLEIFFQPFTGVLPEIPPPVGFKGEVIVPGHEF
jgi:hypothetical protein